MTGARRIGLGNAYTAVSGDFWSMFANPAGLAGLDRMYAGVNVERRFGLAELNYGSGGFAMPFNELHYGGIDFSGFGSKNYSEARLGLTYATSVIDRVRMGVKFNMTNIAISSQNSAVNYGSAFAFYVNAGVNVKLTQDLNLGFSVFNANAANISKELAYKERIPTVLSLGLGYQASDKVLLVADVEKNVAYPLAFHGGVEYKINDFITARMGVGTQPIVFNAGLGVNWRDLQIDFAGSYHQQLGFTPSISGTYRFGKSITEGDKK